MMNHKGYIGVLRVDQEAGVLRGKVVNTRDTITFQGKTVEEATRAAVEALMRAKREGRGRVVIYVEEKMTLKSNYYPRASLDRLSKLSSATDRTEASLLREALDDLFQKHRDEL